MDEDLIRGKFNVKIETLLIDNGVRFIKNMLDSL